MAKNCYLGIMLIASCAVNPEVYSYTQRVQAFSLSFIDMQYIYYNV